MAGSGVDRSRVALAGGLVVGVAAVAATAASGVATGSVPHARLFTAGLYLAWAAGAVLVAVSWTRRGRSPVTWYVTPDGRGFGVRHRWQATLYPLTFLTLVAVQVTFASARHAVPTWVLVLYAVAAGVALGGRAALIAAGQPHLELRPEGVAVRVALWRSVSGRPTFYDWDAIDARRVRPTIGMVVWPRVAGSWRGPRDGAFVPLGVHPAAVASAIAYYAANPPARSAIGAEHERARLGGIVAGPRLPEPGLPEPGLPEPGLRTVERR